MYRKDNKIEIYIVDDHPMIIDGIKNMLKGFDAVKVTGCFNDGESLTEALEEECPDLLILDIQLPDTTGDKLLPMLRTKYPQLKILALTNYNSKLYLNTMMKLGAHGYLLKTTTQDLLIDAIKTIESGNNFIEPSLKGKLDLYNQPNPRKYLTPQLSFTIREKQIIKLLLKGISNQKIAEELFLGFNTVRNYRARIFLKLDVNSIGEFIIRAIQLGLDE